ncbi:MAG: tetratricopeptide repeat protein [Myxococcota bacterium]
MSARPPCRRRMRVSFLGWLLVAGLCAAGCNTFQAGRLYQEGTQALDAGAPERAARLLEQAAERAPEASEIQNHLGLAYWQLGRTEEARMAFERALDLDSDNAAAAHNLRGLDGGP